MVQRGGQAPSLFWPKLPHERELAAGFVGYSIAIRENIHYG